MKCLELCSIKRQCLLLLNCTEENQILILGTLWLIRGMHYFSFSGPRRQLAIPANFFWDIRVRFLSWECWDFWRRNDHFRRFPKKSKDIRRLPKTCEVCRRRSYFSIRREKLARNREPAWDQSFQPAGVRVGRYSLPSSLTLNAPKTAADQATQNRSLAKWINLRLKPLIATLT